MAAKERIEAEQAESFARAMYKLAEKEKKEAKDAENARKQAE